MAEFKCLKAVFISKEVIMDAVLVTIYYVIQKMMSPRKSEEGVNPRKGRSCS